MFERSLMFLAVPFLIAKLIVKIKLRGIYTQSLVNFHSKPPTMLTKIKILV